MSKGAKIAIGVGALALIGTGAYFAFRKKDDDDKPTSKSKLKRSPDKKALGSIALQ